MMKSLSTSIQEALVKKHIPKDWNNAKYKYNPESKEELMSIIGDRLKNEGNECNLNDIDVSKITDMQNLFKDSEFNGDISNWNVSNVTTMKNMFRGSNFNGNISNWDVSKVKNMIGMFWLSNFDGDLSKWNMSNVKYATFMFAASKFSGKNGDISNWDISDCNAEYMFQDSKICIDLSKWIFTHEVHDKYMFAHTPLAKKYKFWPRNYYAN